MSSLKAFGFLVQRSQDDATDCPPTSKDTCPEQWLLPSNASPKSSPLKPCLSALKTTRTKNSPSPTITDYFSKQSNTIIPSPPTESPVHIKQSIPIADVFPQLLVEFEETYSDSDDLDGPDSTTFIMIPVDMPVSRRRKWTDISDSGRIKKRAITGSYDIVAAFQKMTTVDTCHPTIPKDDALPSKQAMDCCQELHCVVRIMSVAESQAWMQDAIAEFLE